jgi:hypothetical protein
MWKQVEKIRDRVIPPWIPLWNQGVEFPLALPPRVGRHVRPWVGFGTAAWGARVPRVRGRVNNQPHGANHMMTSMEILERVDTIMKIASRRSDRETRRDEILHEIQNHAWNEGYFEGKDSVINRIKETIEEIE